MKKTYSLLLLALILSMAAKAQTGWVTKNVDNRISVKFPVEPEIVTKAGVNSYVSKGKDSVKYSSSVMDFMVVAHRDSAALVPVKDMQQFADQLRAGIASQKLNYTFSDITIGKWNSYTAYTMTGVDKNTKGTLWMKMILIGSKMYVLTSLVPVDLVTKNNEIYLASAEFAK